MDVHELRSVVALAEEASFSRAAARLGVAQPSLSQQIKKLEGSCGRPLFDRLPRRVVPTQAGQLLVERARAILAQVSDAQRQLREDPGRVSGSLAVGAIPTIAPYLLPGVLANFARRHPDVEVRIVEDVTDHLVEMIERGELDVAVLSDYDGGRTVHVERLATEPLWLLVSPQHRLAKRRTIAWPDLKHERMLVLHEMHCLSGQVWRLCQRRDVTPPVVMRGAQLTTIAAMVCGGLGVSIVPEMMRAADRSGQCVYLRFAKDPPTRDICTAWSLLRYRTNASRALVDALAEQVTKPHPP
jgi:LysR family transcriptional regulator, hydrogen peroxide-inducible genes activator